MMNIRILSKSIATFLVLGFASFTTGQSTAISWPPPHMKDLPPDYLARQLSHLQMSSISPPDTSIHPVIIVRHAIASLTLEKHVAEFNAYFERDEFVRSLEANSTFGFALFSCSYVRNYAIFNDRTGVMKGRLSAKAQANFEKALWGIAKAYSKLADAHRDAWDQQASENHFLTSKSSDFLVAQFFRDHPDYANLTYDDGSTPQQQYEARVDYWNRWLDVARKARSVRGGRIQLPELPHRGLVQSPRLRHRPGVANKGRHVPRSGLRQLRGRNSGYAAGRTENPHQRGRFPLPGIRHALRLAGGDSRAFVTCAFREQLLPAFSHFEPRTRHQPARQLLVCEARSGRGGSGLRFRPSLVENGFDPHHEPGGLRHPALPRRLPRAGHHRAGSGFPRAAMAGHRFRKRPDGASAWMA